MPAPVSTSAFNASVRTAINQLQHNDSRYDHLILATAQRSTSRDAPFHLIAIAAGGLDSLRAKLDSHETRFALLRVQARILLVVSLGQGVVGIKRAQVLVQGRALQSSLGAILFAVLTIDSPSQLTPALVSCKLQLERSTHVASPNLDQSNRASQASSVASSIITRAKPSAPSSPEELGNDGSWSRPMSDIGPSNHENTQLSSSFFLRAKSLPNTLSPQDTPVTKGIVIHLASDVDAPTQTIDSELASTASRPPTSGQLEEGGSNYQSPLSSQRSSTASSSTPRNSEEPRKSHTWNGSDDCESTRSPLRRLSADERKRLSDERERLRADEAIRAQVMKKLRAEQNSLLRSPISRAPRLGVLPPLAPPPPFAPPPTPSSDPALASPARGPSSHKLLRSPLAGGKQKLDDQRNPGRSKSSDRPMPTRETSQSPRSGSPAQVNEDIHTLEELASEAHSTSESHQSNHSSVLSLNAWNFAETARRKDSLLNASGPASGSNLTILPARAKRSGSGSVTPAQARSRQASGCESVASLGTDHRPCTTPSSRGSIAASSLFDKELPVPPSEMDYEASDGDEWIGSMDWRNSIMPSSAPSTLAASPSPPRQRAPEEAEIQELRERLAQAEARAKAAEHAAKMAVREAHSETRRLAEELAKVEKGTRDRMEAEAVRRAMWAREQVAREQLDAYERTKLEVDETRRRKVIEEQRRAARDRAERIRQEQEWREQEAQRIKQEYELRAQYMAEREAKLKAEAAEEERRERRRQQQAQESQSRRQKRLEELTKTIQSRKRSRKEVRAVPILSGWLNLQTEEGIQWKRRWYEVMYGQLVVCRSPTDRSMTLIIPLNPKAVVAVDEEHEEGHTIQALRLQVLQCGEQHTYTLSADTPAATLDLSLVTEAIANGAGD